MIRRGYIKYNLEQYKSFYYVADEGSFSKAALRLYVTQSAVSQTVMQLEKVMEVKLFVRMPKGIRLTKEGRILYEHLEPAFNLINAGEKRIEEIKEFKSGGITISASDTLCMYYLPPFLEKFKTLYPGISLNIANKTSSETIDMLEKGKADLGIINVSGKKGRNLRIWQSNELNDCFIIKKGNLQNSAKIYTPRDIAQLPLMLLEKGTSTREHSDEYFSEEGIEVSPDIELGSVELLIKFAAIGMGVSCVAREYLEKSNYSELVDIIPLKKQIKKRHIGVVTLRGIPLSKAAEAFLQIILEEE